MASPTTVAKALRQASWEGRDKLLPKIIHHGPWAFGFTAQGTGAGSAGPSPVNILSVKLIPGRCTTEEDWHFLGALLAAIGVPEDVAEEQIKDDDQAHPKGSYYFLWSAE